MSVINHPWLREVEAELLQMMPDIVRATVRRTLLEQKIAQAEERADIKKVIRQKADDIMDGHTLGGRRNSRGDYGYPRDKLINWGWSKSRIIRDIEILYWGGGVCPYCELLGRAVPFRELGLGKFSLDICDPKADPVYGRNTEFICVKHNGSKNHRSKEDYVRSIKQKGVDLFGFEVA